MSNDVLRSDLVPMMYAIVSAKKERGPTCFKYKSYRTILTVHVLVMWSDAEGLRGSTPHWIWGNCWWMILWSQYGPQKPYGIRLMFHRRDHVERMMLYVKHGSRVTNWKKYSRLRRTIFTARTS